MSIEKAREVINNAAGVIRIYHIEPYREARKRITSDINLSQRGKEAKLSELREEFERDTMKSLLEMRNTYDGYLLATRKEAEKVLTQPLPKVDETKVKLFQDKLTQVEAAVMFAPSTQIALEAINRLSDIEEPALAKNAADKVLELSKEILSDVKDKEQRLYTKRTINALHTRLSHVGQPTGGSKAREELSIVEALQKADLVPTVAVNALGEISANVSRYANNPQEYMKLNG
ncbi:hypothetical protein Q73_07595 [Bacillus coahuilensis m2-6]|uniref:hypothetical protein n=1 Tax=Bacillus coahuilensis TaxID=408580 RepID=UPI00075015A9|nr:hypothetical protein [Bacillus coahuilensis]KUP08078.1 hypothetical protein Q73_07595 [Bacillus coahuilensis m2-6]